MSDGWSDADVCFMRDALDEAAKAGAAGEVPVGAVLVSAGKIEGRGGNRSICDHDPSAHAEIVALREAGRIAGNHRLPNSTLYVTLEPCAMCVGALVQARVARVVFGAYDNRAGALGSALDLEGASALNHRFEVNGGLLESDCAALLGEFFASRRGVS